MEFSYKVLLFSVSSHHFYVASIRSDVELFDRTIVELLGYSTKGQRNHHDGSKTQRCSDR